MLNRTKTRPSHYHRLGKTNIACTTKFQGVVCDTSRAILEHGKKVKMVGVNLNEQQSILRKIDCCSFHFTPTIFTFFPCSKMALPQLFEFRRARCLIWSENLASPSRRVIGFGGWPNHLTCHSLWVWRPRSSSVRPSGTAVQVRCWDPGWPSWPAPWESR